MVRGQREKMYNGQMGDKSLKMRVGRECIISSRKARLYSGDVHVGGVRGGSHSVTAGGQLQE